MSCKHLGTATSPSILETITRVLLVTFSYFLYFSPISSPKVLVVILLLGCLLYFENLRGFSPILVLLTMVSIKSLAEGARLKG